MQTVCVTSDVPERPICVGEELTIDTGDGTSVAGKVVAVSESEDGRRVDLTVEVPDGTFPTGESLQGTGVEGWRRHFERVSDRITLFLERKALASDRRRTGSPQ